MFYGCLSIKAESKKETNGEKIERLKIERCTHRPEAPSRVFIECHYWRGKIRLVFPPQSDMRSAEVIISKEESAIWMGYVTRENPEVAIPVLFGEYDITCHTDGNQIFKGKLNFE